MSFSGKVAKLQIVALLLILCFVKQTTSQSCNRETLKYFQNSIKFHYRPTLEANWHACHDEFSKYKSCCETESLKDYMQKAVESDSLRWNNALKSVYIFRNEIINNLDALVAKVKELFPLIDPAVRESRVKQIGYDSAKMLNKFLPLLTKEYYNETELHYRKEAQSCFDEVSTLRKNALCLVCSGRSLTYFNGERMNIKQRTCEGLTESCYNSFSFMFSIMGTSRAFLDLINALERTTVYPEARDPLPYNSNHFLTKILQSTSSTRTSPSLS